MVSLWIWILSWEHQEGVIWEYTLENGSLVTLKSTTGMCWGCGRKPTALKCFNKMFD